MAATIISSADFMVPAEVLRLEIAQELETAKLLTYPALNLFQKESAYQSSINFPVNVGGAVASGRAVTDPIPTTAQDSVVQGTLPISDRVVSHVFSVLLNDVTQAARTAPQALRNLFRAHIKSGTEAILRKLNQDILVGDGTNAYDGVYGLGYVIDNTKVYAGIDPTTYPLWTCAQDTNATARALTFRMLENVQAQIITKGGNFTRLLVHPTVAVNYKALFTPIIYQNSGEGAGTVDPGYTGLAYAGRPVTQDPDMPTDRIYFVDESKVAVYTMDQSLAIAQLKTPTMMVQENGLNMLINQQPVANAYSVTFEMSLQPQLQVKNRTKALAAVLRLNG